MSSNVDQEKKQVRSCSHGEPAKEKKIQTPSAANQSSPNTSVLHLYTGGAVYSTFMLLIRLDKSVRNLKAQSRRFLAAYSHFIYQQFSDDHQTDSFGFWSVTFVWTVTQFHSSSSQTFTLTVCSFTPSRFPVKQPGHVFGRKTALTDRKQSSLELKVLWVWTV